jgi:threonine dehydrogenase-like Zn-dependent dehydrogenase
MQALFWDGTTARVIEHVTPALADGMALVRVNVAGVCNTDLEITRGYMQFRGILGHEFVGVVENGPPNWRGARVVGEINFGCGRCDNCARGLARHCPTRRVMGILRADGAFAELVAVPLCNLHRVPDGIPDEAAVFAEPLAAAFEILEQVHVTAVTDCVVLGDGKLGLLAAQVLFQAGARVTVVGKHAHKLALLRQRGIAAVPLQEWQGAAADLVVEATGSAAGPAAALAATKPRGVLILKSTVAGPTTLDLASVVINEVTVVGSRCGSFAPALRALAANSVDVLSLISARRPLTQAAEALQLAARPGTLKVLLTAK